MQRRSLVFAGPALLTAGMATRTSYGAAAPVNTIKFGQSASLTGGQAAYGRDIREGIMAAFAAASALPGSPHFELVTLDDGGLKDRCVANVAALIEGGVSAIVGLTNGIAAEACVPLANNSQIALLGTASGNMGLRTAATSGGVFHVRAGYDLEYRHMANYIKDFGLRRIGYVHLKDTSPANLSAMTQALNNVSIVPVASIPVDRTASSFDDVVAKLMEAKCDCVLLSANAGPVASIIDKMKTAHYAGLFYASSYAGQGLMDILTSRKQSCIMSMVVPRPNSGASNVVTRARQDFAALGPDAKISITTLEGYIAGRTAVEAARAALKVGGERLSRVRMKESLAGLRTDLGGYRVEFSPGVTQGSQYVDLISIDRWGRLAG